MTVTYHGEIAGSRSASNNLGVRTYTRAFRLTTDDRTDTAYDVGSHGSLPVIGSTFPDDTTAYCQRIDIRNSHPWKGWTATYNYSTEREISQSDPESDEVLVSFTSEIYREPVFQDINGDAITNSAGDYYIDPTPERDAAHLIARIQSNHAAIPAWVLSYQNAINDGTISINGLQIGPRQCKVQRIDVGERQKRNTSTFYPLTLELHIHNDGWLLEPLDAGFREIVNLLGLKFRAQIVNEGDGEFPAQPVPLDGAGEVLDDPTPQNAQFRSHKIYAELDFSVLPGVT